VAVDTRMWDGVYSGSDLQTDIEFIRMATGPARSYLAENIPAYTARKDRVDAFLAQPMPMISQLDYMPYNNNQ